MSDRLAELQRQRALAQEQLAWFDREIAKETGLVPAVPLMPASRSAPTVTPIAPTSDAATGHVADEIIAQYEKNPQSAATDVKRGCYIWFFVALSVLGMGAVLIYFLYNRPQ